MDGLGHAARERTGDARVGIDDGLEHWAHFDDGTVIDNPGWTRSAAGQMADLQRQRARKRRGSVRYRRLSRDIRRLHGNTGNARQDFLHTHTTALAKRCSVIATEAIQTSNMSHTARGSVDALRRRVDRRPAAIGKCSRPAWPCPTPCPTPCSRTKRRTLVRGCMCRKREVSNPRSAAHSAGAP